MSSTVRRSQVLCRLDIWALAALVALLAGNVGRAAPQADPWPPSQVAAAAPLLLASGGSGDDAAKRRRIRANDAHDHGVGNVGAQPAGPAQHQPAPGPGAQPAANPANPLLPPPPPNLPPGPGWQPNVNLPPPPPPANFDPQAVPILGGQPTPGVAPAPGGLPDPGNVPDLGQMPGAIPGPAQPPANARTTGNADPNAPRINLDPDATRVYDDELEAPFKFDPSRTPVIPYKGAVKFDRANIPYLEDGVLMLRNGPSPIGRLLADGANSKVYESQSQPGIRVKKIVALTRPGKTIAQVAATLADQSVGRAILNDIKKAQPWSPYRVAERDGEILVIEATHDGQQYHFALSRDENIASTTVVLDTSRPDFGKSVEVSNALERVRTRPRDQQTGQQTLSYAEELTVNLVIRDLNENGVVWADHKLANFDIVLDPSSRTGYRVIFFDFDCFRPVHGTDRKSRYEAARELQRAYDSAANEWDERQKLMGILRRRYSGGRQNHFDYTAFGVARLHTPSTPGANQSRGDDYSSLTFMTREEFSRAVADYNAATGFTAVYEADGKPE